MSLLGTLGAFVGGRAFRALAPIASTAIGSIFAHRAARRSRRFSVNQISEMNKYNAPINQMARFREAGLNPMLMYGQGTPGQQTQVAQPIYSDKAPFDPQSAFSDYYDTGYKKESVDVREMEYWLREAQKALNIENYHFRKIETEMLKATRSEQEEGIKAEQAIKIARAVVENKYAEWASQGINPRDSSWIRVTIEILEALGVGPERIRQVFDKVKLP